ncbi:MAG: shikimate dehydrogenase [Clostridia bacterium]|nr:shikimate dehydrogenase [Clostridia bacterium]
MNVKKLRLGLIGKDVSQSKSKQIHTFILNRWGVECEYVFFSVRKEEFDNTMRCLLGDFDGFNVTIPYKRDVMEYLDGVEGDAMAFGAVNTVLTSTRTGYNTDGVGFMQMLRAANICPQGKKVLVLGAGGAGRSTAVALKLAGAEVFLYQRNREKLLETCQELGIQPAESGEQGGFDILVNCTGVGMHDTQGRSPVGTAAFEGAVAAIDLIYLPQETEFLRLAKACGSQTLNGESMLFYQAYYADCLYLGKMPDDAEAEELYTQYRIWKEKAGV